MKANKLLTLLFFICKFGFAQEYVPLPESPKTVLDEKSSYFLEKSKDYRSGIKASYKGKLGKQIENNFEGMQTDFNDEILNGNILFNEKIENFVEKIISEINSNNPDVPKMDFYISKDGSANAYTMGDYNILINLGLFYYLDNEAEIASVISHEIGHQMMNHSINTQISEFEKSHSRDFKNELDQLKKSKYNTQNKALNLLKSHLYNLSARTRSNELQADSIGFIIYQNTSYPEDQYLKALETLKKYDTIKPRGVKTDTYKKFFNLENQPFKEKWLELEDFSDYNYTYKDKLDEDSLSTHPETVERINHLKKLFPVLQKESTVTKPGSDYEEIFEIAKYERIPNLYFNEQYGDGVYLALLNLQEDPENQYYKDWLGKNFNQIYEARKNYTLNRYLDRIDPENQSESYQQFLSFMWNLRLEEIEIIKNYYYKDNDGNE